MPDLPHDLPEPGPDAPLPGPAPEPAIRTRGLSLLDVPPGALEPEGPLAQVAAQLVAAPADLAGGSLHAVGASGSISVAPHVSRPVAGLYVAAPTEAALEGWIASIDDALRRSREAAAHGPLHGRTALPLLAGLTLVVAACSILYELLLAQTLSALLGNTVLRYSITIGVFLGALGAGAILCGRQPARAAERLVRVELLLSIIGAASVPALYLFDGMQRIYWVHDTSDSNIGPAAFFVASHALIAAIGVLSGFEIPLLLQLGERIRRGSTNVVLGVDYLGSLVGSVLFPIVLLRELGLMKTAFVVAWLNALACIIAIAWLRPRRWRLAGFGAAVVLALLPFAIMRAEAIETHFVRKYYDFGQVDDIGDLLSTREGEADVQRHWSPYQFIDVVRDGDDTQWFTDLLSRRRKNAPSAPRDLWLYLNGDFQMFSGAEEFYHEWFVHAPVQGAGRAPRSALVLGGGDGLVVRELVDYPQLRRLVHVELDPEMLELLHGDPALRAIAEDPHDDPRVELVNGDAFTWLRRHDERFDAIFIDMPYPMDYGHATVYSREFYMLVRRHLRPGGFVAMDAPDGDCAAEGSLWPIYSSTLRAAGFATVRGVVSRVPVDDPRILRRVTAAQSYTYVRDGKQVTLEGDRAQDAVGRQMHDAWLEFPEHFFMLAAPEPWSPSLQWTEFGVEYDALRPHLLDEAFDVACEPVEDPRQVNSIFRPTLPELELLAVRTP